MTKQKSVVSKENYVKTHQREMYENEWCVEAKAIFSSKVLLFAEWKSSSQMMFCLPYIIFTLYIYVMWALCVWGFALEGVKCRNIFITLWHCLYRDVMNRIYTNIILNSPIHVYIITTCSHGLTRNIRVRLI